jgi:hypothetical protein
MGALGCARERETGEVLERGQWPDACSQELRAHVQSCRVCGELAIVKLALRGERAAAMAQATVPSASALWWRAHLRKRNEAMQRIGRPIVGAEIFAIAMAVVVAVCGAGWALRSGVDIAWWIGSLHLDTLWPLSASFQGGLWIVVSLLSVLAVVGGLVVYFASEKQ